MNFVEKIRTHFMFNDFHSFSKIVPFMRYVEKCWRAG